MNREATWMAVLAALSLAGCIVGETGEEQAEEEEQTAVDESALATAKCAATYEIHKFDLPNKSDLEMGVLPCVQKNAAGDKVRALVSFWWNEASAVTFGDGSKKFNDFILNVRLERKSASGDVMGTSTNCDKEEIVNAMWDGSSYCRGPWHARGGASWSSDGKLVYDKAGDGKDNFTWDFHGSPWMPPP